MLAGLFAIAVASEGGELLSGFVIAYAYEPKLNTGTTFREFLISVSYGYIQ